MTLICLGLIIYSFTLIVKKIQLSSPISIVILICIICGVIVYMRVTNCMTCFKSSQIADNDSNDTESSTLNV